MSAQPWMKFYPRDWRGDQALRVISLPARGLWIEMLCVMHEGSPYGHLTVGAQPCSDAALARLVGTSVEEVQALLVELNAAGVFRRTRGGVIYSKRMTADHKRSIEGKKAKLEAIEKAKENQGPSRVASSLPATQKAEGRVQSLEVVPFPAPSEKTKPQQTGEAVRRGSRLRVGWDGDEPGDAVIFAIGEGLNDAEAFRVLDDFRDFWTAKSGADAIKLDWMATWRRWVREDLRRRQRSPAGRPSKRVSFV